jgi:hypothetical protein
LSVTITDPIAGPFVPNGVTTAFPFEFKAGSADEIMLVQVLNGVPATINPANYSVAIASDGEGGTVTFTAAPLTGSGNLYIVSDPDFSQQAAFGSATAFNVASLTDLFDRAAIRDLVLLEKLGRTPQVPVGESIGAFPGLDIRKGKYLIFDPLTGEPGVGNGQGPKGDPGGNALAIGLATSIAALNLPVGLGDLFRTTGYAAADDNGQAWYRRMGALEAVTQGELVSADAVRLGLLRKQPLSPEMFGAPANGVNDDYAAFKALTAFINANGTGHIVLGLKKNYLLNQHVTVANGVLATDTQFNQITGLVIEGNGSKIDIQGAFDRNASTTYGLPGILLNRCSFVRILDLELDGNVDQTTNTSGSVEAAYPVGVACYSCNDVVLNNVYCHHFSTDGFSFRAAASWDGVKTYVSRRALMLNCRSLNNARQGITLEGVRGFTAIGCEFSNIGKTDGTYGPHAPVCGVDIEPNFSTTSAAPNTRDASTGEILFQNCHFENNGGGSWKSVGNTTLPAGETIDTIAFVNCTVIADNTLTGEDEIILGTRGTKVEGCEIKLNGNLMHLGFGADATVTIDFQRNTVRGRNDLLRCAYAVRRVNVKDNFFIVEPVGTYAHFVWNATSTAVKFENNFIYIPQAAYIDGGVGDGHQVIAVDTCHGIIRNRYLTDLPAALGSEGKAHFAHRYGGAKAYDEVFVGTAVGKLDTFRPIITSTDFDTTYPYNRNHDKANAPGVLKPGDAATTLIASRTPKLVIYDVPITADRAVTLSVTDAFAGARHRIVRKASATGAFNVNVGAGPLKAMATPGSFCDVEWDVAAAAWVLAAYGTL